MAMYMADGRKTLAEVRSGANDRKAKHRANTDRPFRNGHSSEFPQRNHSEQPTFLGLLCQHAHLNKMTDGPI